MKITGVDIVRLVANKIKVKKDTVHRVVQETFREVENSLKGGHKVVFVNFGVFEPKINKEGMKRNPRTNKAVYKEESIRPHFRALDGFKDAVNGDDQKKK